MSKSVYDRILKDIMSGALAPATVLSESAFAERYGTSRTPIREALQRLSTDQLVERTSRGIQVRATTPEEILDIYEVRVTLEGAAARAAAKRRTELDLLRLKSARDAMRAVADGGDRQRADTNRAFHETLWFASHSPTLIDLLKRLSTHLHRYPSTTLTFGDRWDEVLREHDVILDAIEAEDAETAGTIAEEHMSKARDVRLRMYAQEAMSQ